MAEKTCQLTIIGKPGAEVRIVYRDRGDEPPPDVWSGKLGSDGKATVSVPQAYLVVLGSGESIPLPLHQTPAETETVNLKFD